MPLKGRSAFRGQLNADFQNFWNRIRSNYKVASMVKLKPYISKTRTPAAPISNTVSLGDPPRAYTKGNKYVQVEPLKKRVFRLDPKQNMYIETKTKHNIESNALNSVVNGYKDLIKSVINQYSPVKFEHIDFTFKVQDVRLAGDDKVAYRVIKFETKDLKAKNPLYRPFLNGDNKIRGKVKFALAPDQKGLYILISRIKFPKVGLQVKPSSGRSRLVYYQDLEQLWGGIQKGIKSTVQGQRSQSQESAKPSPTSEATDKPTTALDTGETVKNPSVSEKPVLTVTTVPDENQRFKDYRIIHVDDGTTFGPISISHPTPDFPPSKPINTIPAEGIPRAKPIMSTEAATAISVASAVGTVAVVHGLSTRTGNSDQ